MIGEKEDFFYILLQLNISSAIVLTSKILRRLDLISLLTVGVLATGFVGEFTLLRNFVQFFRSLYDTDATC